MNLTRSLFCLAVIVNLSAATMHGFEFRVVSWSGAVTDLKLSQRKGGEEFLLRANEDTLSPVYRVKGEGPLNLFRTSPASSGPEIKTLVATLPLPAGIEQAILVLVPASSDGSAYKGLWLDDSPAERPVNTISLHNLAGRPLALKMGADQRLLPPQGAHLQSFKEGQRSVNVQVAMQTGETWERVISSPQPVKPGFRILILLREGRRLSDGSINAIDRVTFYDYSPPIASP